MTRFVIILCLGLLLGLSHSAFCSEVESVVPESILVDPPQAEVKATEKSIGDVEVAATDIKVLNVDPSSEGQNIAVAALTETEISNVNNAENAGIESHADGESHVRVTRQFFFPQPFFGGGRRFYGGGFGGGRFGGGGFGGRRFYGGRGFGGGGFGGRRFGRGRFYG